MIKRTISLGLAGMVLAIGSAESATCYAVDALGSVSKGPVRRPDLVGLQVREVRRSWVRRWSAIEVAHGRERFTIRYDFTPRTTPAVMGFSWKGSTAPLVVWGKRDAFKPNIGATIEDGPLAGLTLKPEPCNNEGSL